LIYEFAWNDFCDWYLEFQKIRFNNPEFKNRILSESLLIEILDNILIMMNPFMPHLSEEIWTSLGKNSELTFSSWPKFNPNLVKLDMRTIGVQVNGKRRSEIEIYDEDIESTVLKKAKDDKKVLSHIEGKVIIKEIYIKNKIVNIVVK